MILVGDVIEQLRTLPDQSVQCVVTSPPYWGLRDYGVDGQIGLEPTIEEYVDKMVAVFREVRRVLRDDGTLWMNLGDAYANPSLPGNRQPSRPDSGRDQSRPMPKSGVPAGLKAKDLIGMPWRVAFALQVDGWYLRSDIIWSKPNPMPESCRDRPTKAHEYVFLLTKCPRYYYDAEAIKVKMLQSSVDRIRQETFNSQKGGPKDPRNGGEGSRNRSARQGLENIHDKIINDVSKAKANRRTVWNIPTQPTKEAHFATFPEKLVQLCILAGSGRKGCCSECGAAWSRVILPTGHKNNREPAHVPGNSKTKTDSTGWKPAMIDSGGWVDNCECVAEVVPCVVLDPFLGSGTTGLVAQNEGRDWIGIELNKEYAAIAKKRVAHKQESFA